MPHNRERNTVNVTYLSLDQIRVSVSSFLLVYVSYNSDIILTTTINSVILSMVINIYQFPACRRFKVSK